MNGEHFAPLVIIVYFQVERNGHNLFNSLLDLKIALEFIKVIALGFEYANIGFNLVVILGYQFFFVLEDVENFVELKCQVQY